MAAFLPLTALAASTDLPAGFAPNSIWVSRTHITAGDAINIFTVVYNSSEVPLTGDVNFTIDGKSIGRRNFSIKAGETQIESVPWISLAGTHAVFARIEKIADADTSASATVLNQTTDTITISVASAPPPSPAEQAVTTATNLVSAGVASAAPAAQAAVNALENLRQRAIDALQNQLTAGQTNSAGEVLGASTYRAPKNTATSTDTKNGSVFSSLWHGLLSALLFICRLQILFYSTLVFVIFILYRLLRTWMQER